MLYYFFTFQWWSSALYLLSNGLAHYIIVLFTCIPFSQRCFYYIPLIVLLVLIICLSRYFNRIYELQTDVDHDFLHPLLPLCRFTFSVCHDVKICFIMFIFLISFRIWQKRHQDYSDRWRQICVGKSTRSKWVSHQITRDWLLEGKFSSGVW